MTVAPNLTNHPLTSWNGPLSLPNFANVVDEDFGPVMKAALAAHEAEVQTIADNPEAPTIENTMALMELAGEPLSRVSAIFWGLAGAHTNPVIQKLEREMSPLMARHMTRIYMNDALFGRIDALYQQRDTLDLNKETARVLEKTWKRFVRGGAKLAGAEKERLTAINEELATLGAQFGQNVLADESAWSLMLDESDLDGLSASLRSAMASAASERGKAGRYAVTLSRSIAEPFLASSARRDLREIVLKAFAARGANAGEANNREIVRRTLELRAEKAQLLGYKTFAAYKLDDTMAKTPEAVMDLLLPVWQKAKEKAAKDEKDLQRLAAAEGNNHAIAAWDWRYYAEKLRTERFDFDEGTLKPYLALEGVIAAAFDVAGKLFGLSFEEQSGIAGWHEDVRTFVVKNRDGSQRGLFLADYFNRPSKRSGAWMSAFQSGYKLGSGKQPIIYNVMNFAKPPLGEPALLSVDDARTLFHEFGHALHGLLTEVTWPSIAGTAVSRDFVELPSQLYEHWFNVPEVLQTHARHVKTGEPMPLDLLEKMRLARNFNSGFATTEFTASALVDMAFHSRTSAPQDPFAFEIETLEQLGAPSAIPTRHSTPHFLHAFSGDGYSAGYYSYMWSEVLDADAFRAFEEVGDPFSQEVAGKLQRYIYSAGGSEDPEVLYKAFRGRMPSPEAMMEKKGLV